MATEIMNGEVMADAAEKVIESSDLAKGIGIGAGAVVGVIALVKLGRKLVQIAKTKMEEKDNFIEVEAVESEMVSKDVPTNVKVEK